MTSADQDAIAKTCWGEMRGEGEQGMIAVVCVIMNRVAKQTWYGLTPLEVCMKHARLKNGQVVYQFDCNDPNDPNYAKCQAVTTDDPQYANALTIAGKAIAGTLVDITESSTHYYSEPASPVWAQNKTPCLTIGKTHFFNNIA